MICQQRTNFSGIKTSTFWYYLLCCFGNVGYAVKPRTMRKRSSVNYTVKMGKAFYVRKITEAEKAYLKNLIMANDSLTPEMLYYSFALSDEYQYY